MENEHQLTLENSYALRQDDVRKKITAGEGMAGECAVSKKLVLTQDIREESFNINFASANIKPVNIIVFPLLFENEVKGVMELGTLYPYTEREMDFFKTISENIGIAVHTVQNRQRIQELLEETQSQAEELMSQQSALEQINTELEAQAQQLQTSEEELKVQSEELIETNSLLEERSATLEQRNQLISQKNKEIEKRAEDLALSTKYKSEFLANMSHELRTPLNSILLLSRLMSENNEKNLTPEQVQYAQVIQSSGNGLLQLIDEILDLSKIESGKMTIEYLPVKISDITNGLNAIFEPVAKEQQLHWNIVTGAEVPETIETDKMRLDQALHMLKQQKDIGAALVDMMMPEMDGYELISLIRKFPLLNDLWLIAVTAQAMPGDKEKCLAAGADIYISKPIDIDILMQALNDPLKQRK